MPPPPPCPTSVQAVTLAQLDGVRRELEEVVRQQAPYVVLAKVRMRWLVDCVYCLEHVSGLSTGRRV